jgi:hypothetical protein
LASIAAWLLAGHGLWLAIFWGLLQVPESSIWMLALSALLAATLAVLAAAVQSGASSAWQLDRPLASALATGSRRCHAALLAGLVFGALWWATGALVSWHAGIAGQIDAAYIARTGRSHTQWIHATVFWIVMFLRWAIGLTLAVTLLAAAVTNGVRSLVNGAWVRSALTPRTWLTVTFWFVLLVAIPWHLVDRRPRSLSLGLEPWFVGAKLAIVAIAMAVGWALVLRVGHDQSPQQANAAKN